MTPIGKPLLSTLLCACAGLVTVIGCGANFDWHPFTGGLGPALLLLFCATAGGALGGWVTARFYGRAGPLGWGLSALGFLLATILGSAAAGLVFFGPRPEADLGFSMLAGPFGVLIALLGRPDFGLLWLAAIPVLHLSHRRNFTTVTRRDP